MNTCDLTLLQGGKSGNTGGNLSNIFNQSSFTSPGINLDLIIIILIIIVVMVGFKD